MRYGAPHAELDLLPASLLMTCLLGAKDLPRRAAVRLAADI
jgi:hypothetical protein